MIVSKQKLCHFRLFKLIAMQIETFEIAVLKRSIQHKNIFCFIINFSKKIYQQCRLIE